MRTKLVLKLAEGWRKAETHYINSEFEDDTWKTNMFEKQEKAKLTPEEKQLLNDECYAMGV